MFMQGRREDRRQLVLNITSSDSSPNDGNVKKTFDAQMSCQRGILGDGKVGSLAYGVFKTSQVTARGRCKAASPVRLLGQVT